VVVALEREKKSLSTKLTYLIFTTAPGQVEFPDEEAGLCKTQQCEADED
jgi:hypothetical protein